MILAVALGNFTLNAQSTAMQAILKNTANRTDVVIVSGKITDISTQKPIANAKLNLSENSGVIDAVVDENGYYALALNKKAITEKDTRIEFNINGYEAALKKVRKNADFINMDIRMLPDESQQPVTGKYSAKADPFNSLVMNF